MARSAKFALPEIGLGNFLGGGASHILPRLVGLAKAREIVFLGEAIDGEEALRIGLANRCFSDASFHDEAQRFALRLAEQAPLPMRLAKRLLNDAKRLSFDQALDEEKDGMAQCLASQDWQEGLAAFQEKRKPRFQGR
jgi:enoyl-CoA hydratase